MSFKSSLAAQYLNIGGVVSIPTDTIQGLSCLPNDNNAVNRIITLKQRSINKGLILLASEVKFFADFVNDVNLLKQIEPSNTPTTYLVKANKNINPALIGGFDTVAIRLTTNKLIKDICNKTGSAIVSTSANISGRNTANSILKLKIFFKNELDFIISPENYNNKPSKIINLATGERIR